MAETIMRPATHADLDLVLRELRDVIQTSPHYSDRFKEHETNRLDKSFLKGLLAIDPWHIMISCVDGVPAGAIWLEAVREGR